MRFICVSDTHNQRIPRFHGDVLLHAGDLTTRGTEAELKEAAEHLAGYPCRNIVVVPGNHDLLFESDEEKARSLFEKHRIKVLINQSTEINTVKLYGSPAVIECWGAFGFNNIDKLDPWDRIPSDTEILVTHSPPSYILDKAPRGEHCGCPSLMRKISEVKPKFHVFGHIHCGYGFEYDGRTTFINAAIVSEKYQPLNPPIVFHYGPPGAFERW